MTETTRRILDQVLKLTPEERTEFITALHEACPDEADEALDAEWLDECRRRLAAFKADGKAVPWDQVQVELESRRRRRAQ